MNIYDKALRKLSARPRTVWEMRKYLEGEGFDKGEIDEVVEEFKTMHYLDDEEYCRMFARRELGRGRGKALIARKLRELGVGEFVVDDVLDEEEFDLDEKSLAMEEAQRVIRMAGAEPPYSEKIIGRVARRLQSKGYKADVIYGIIGELRRCVI